MVIETKREEEEGENYGIRADEMVNYYKSLFLQDKMFFFFFFFWWIRFLFYEELIYSLLHLHAELKSSSILYSEDVHTIKVVLLNQSPFLSTLRKWKWQKGHTTRSNQEIKGSNANESNLKK